LVTTKVPAVLYILM